MEVVQHFSKVGLTSEFWSVKPSKYGIEGLTSEFWFDARLFEVEEWQIEQQGRELSKTKHDPMAEAFSVTLIVCTGHKLRKLRAVGGGWCSKPNVREAVKT